MIQKPPYDQSDIDEDRPELLLYTLGDGPCGFRPGPAIAFLAAALIALMLAETRPAARRRRRVLRRRRVPHTSRFWLAWVFC